MGRSRNLLPVLLVAAVHLALTAYTLLGSVYFTFPGEPGFDQGAAERAASFGKAVFVLGFPILPILMRFPASPLVDGPIAWVWLALNSLLWAAAIVAVWRTFARRLARSRQENTNAA